MSPRDSQQYPSPGRRSLVTNTVFTLAWRVVILSILLFVFSSSITSSLSVSAHPEERRYFQALQDDDLSIVASMSPQPWTSVSSGHLKELLIPRAAGSDNITQVRSYISGVFSDLGWHMETDTFVGATPIGDISFTNLIFTFNPDAPTRLVLAAHYDSKWFSTYPANQFIGATDSAAPCAMLLDLAEALTPLLRKTDEKDTETTLQIIFFDGEEAFHDWTATDSIYGARHLAEKWETTFLPSKHAYHTSGLARRRMTPRPTVLSTIEHMVLLDLLGSQNPRILSSYRETDWLHSELNDIDVRLQESELVHVADDEGVWFPSAKWSGQIEDDHVPFITRGVSVLHVIPIPFPKVWHTIKVR